MPELPEVEITARKLKKIGLVGSRLAYFKFLSSKQFRSHIKFSGIKKDVAGRKIKRIWRKGKVIFIDLDGEPPRTMAIHLKMSGRLSVVSKKEPIDKSARFIVGFRDGRELRFKDPRRFGIIWYDSPENILKEKYLAALGTDMLNISYGKFAKGLSSHDGAIKAILLRQDIFAGIGNITADEALWEAGIHPKTRVGDLNPKRIKTLYASISRVIRRILSAGGTSMRDWGHPDNETGGYQNHFKIYGQIRCPRCGCSAVKIKVAGRSSSVCPKCQTKTPRRKS
ncbi:MAG: DNA-formamidopyrimidine glycosylase [Candidatus Niyogibacteria bacterium RIFCSPHIGHO2_01_FULL_45_28]|uniref:DNA-formamidopyrimidine glycosylase n=1 Tax=Candidatus Niyogibacteria bacterium RIFCSPLOWO2_02_FULL_45_13 TaxID=1801725 RepID=A0A1G2EY25_9BACT|nr:MAG: DNA-formamidopyrimidine glycosylase [Candidatus Niyogibacteria bacterium RIFCSPHIGHO2_01_FULL_45_28]OGZ30714.1 MAG: DNA-formamidopyrimidine glycosylase [Candidatus Niyogibacteria bacterium RIFCSPLOWO2_02_FULL_45_13]